MVDAAAGGSGAAATISTGGSALNTPVVSAGGSGYLVGPQVVVTPTGGDAPTRTAVLTANLTAGVVTSLTIVEAGVGYAHVPTLSFVVAGAGDTITVSLDVDTYVALESYRKSFFTQVLSGDTYVASYTYNSVQAMLKALLTQYIVSPALQAFPTTGVAPAITAVTDAVATVTTTIAATVVDAIRNLWTGTRNVAYGGFGSYEISETGTGSAPDSTTQAIKIAEYHGDATPVRHEKILYTDMLSGQKTISMHFKAIENSWVYLTAKVDGVFLRTWFHLSGSGSVGTDAFGTGAIVTVAGGGGGWYRCSVTFTAMTEAIWLGFGLATGDAAHTYASTNGNGVWQWGQQLEVGALTAYQAN